MGTVRWTLKILDDANLPIPAISYYLCNHWINFCWYVKASILEPNSPNNLHWVHTTPWHAHGSKLPEYNTKTIYITPEDVSSNLGKQTSPKSSCIIFIKDIVNDTAMNLLLIGRFISQDFWCHPFWLQLKSKKWSNHWFCIETSTITTWIKPSNIEWMPWLHITCDQTCILVMQFILKSQKLRSLGCKNYFDSSM